MKNINFENAMKTVVALAVASLSIACTSCDEKDDNILNEYTVTFYGWNDEYLSDENVLEGQSAKAPEVEQVISTDSCDWTFKGWDKDFNNVVSDLVVNAVYVAGDEKTSSVGVKFEGIEKADTTITFAWNESVSDASVIAKLGNLEVEGYTWKYENGVVTYTIKSFKVTFDFGDIRENVEVEVAYGESAVAPSDVEVEGYTFEGWNGEFETVTSDNVVYAKYTAMTLDIQWVSSVEVVQYTYSGHTDATYGLEFTAKGYAHSYYVKDLKAGVSRENVYVKEADGTVKIMSTVYLLGPRTNIAVYRLPEADTEGKFAYIETSDGTDATPYYETQLVEKEL